MKNIQQGKNKDFAREFFLTFTTQEKVSKKLYPKRKKQGKGRKKKQNLIHYVEPILNARCQEWQTLGFLNEKPVYFKDKLGRPQQRKWKIMNFEPIHQFCAEKNNPLTTQEKKLLWDLLSSPKIRAAILKEYPQEDIINAVLKFYIKHCILADYFSYTDKQEIANNKLTHKSRLSELIVSDKYLRQSIADKYRDKEKKVTENIKHPLLLWQYNQKMITNYHLVKSLDKKIMNSLGVYPFT